MVSGDNLPRRKCGYGLAGEYYRSRDLYERELESIWQSAWLFCGLTCDLPNDGDYLTLEVGYASVLVLRDGGVIRAFHNICPHRGTVLCEEASGRVGKLIVCPYHQWSFNRSGELQSCRGMQPVDREALGLHKIDVTVTGGMIFISLAEKPPNAADLQRLFGSAEPHGFDRARVAHCVDYRVAANWKVIWENNRECYHCDAGHPQYVRANFDMYEGDRDNEASRSARAAVLARAAAYWDAEGLSIKHIEGGLARFPDPADRQPFPASATRTVMVDGYETESMDGKRVAPLMGTLKSPQVGVLRLRSLPSFWCHASCDHAVLTRVLPDGCASTRVRVYWLVDQSAKEGVDYALERLLPFWQLTSEQDWQICEKVQRGLNSPAYRPGPLSHIREYNVEAFLNWYLARMA